MNNGKRIEEIEKRSFEILNECGAHLKNGHFILSSGLRSEEYVQIGKVQANYKKMKELSDLLAEKIRISYPDLRIDIVASPAIGGIIPSYQLSGSLGVNENIFCERSKETNEFEFRRGYFIEAGKNYLIVEDVVTTGGSFLKVADLIKKSGGNVVLITSFIDRTGGKTFEYPFISSVKLDIKTYDPANLPDHLKDIPPVKPGSNNKPF
jgi:orotate phosphoribosyltransferase